jgi:hypothetical protein
MHLFFESRFARAVWSIIQAASGLCQPYSVPNMFGTRLSGISKDLKSLALLGTAATVWSIWLCHHLKRKHHHLLCRLFVSYTLAPVLSYPPEA